MNSPFRGQATFLGRIRCRLGSNTKSIRRRAMAGGGGAGAAADNQPPWKAAVAFFVFAALNITLNQFNSWALKGHHFPGFDFPVSCAPP